MTAKEQTCCFTGHRDIPLHQLPIIKSKLKKTIIEYIEKGYCYFGAGGALGFDTIAAQTVLKLKETYPQIKLILVLPCLTQTRGWKEADVKKYERIKGLADKVVYTSQEYTRGCMFKRNRHLVDFSSLCIAYLNKDEGGTAYTVKYAKQSGLNIINLA